MAKKKDKAEDKDKAKAKDKAEGKVKDKAKAKDKAEDKDKAKVKDKAKDKASSKGQSKDKPKDKSKAKENPQETSAPADPAKMPASEKSKKVMTTPVESIPKVKEKPDWTVERDLPPADDARPPSDAATDPDLLLTVGHVYRSSVSELQAALKTESISASQWEILSFLSADTPLTQQMLARSLYVSEGNITQMLTKMESLGWIERKRDWRTNYVTLSTAGAALQAHVRSVYDDAGRRFFAVLSDDERLLLSRLLTRLLPETDSGN